MKRYEYIVILFVLLLASCANRGAGPQGGPRDTIPPVVLEEYPKNGTLLFQEKELTIQFDEYIQLDDVQKNVLISPPQQNPPEVKAVGKKVSVVFQEDLLDSTTYTIDFGAAICDYNEKTPLTGYVLSFSTGNHIDSLSVSGYVYDASTLSPMADVLVGIHQNLEDSALSTLPFTRITRTNIEGGFTIYNIRPGSYRLYALNDVSRDFLYQPGEGLAFCDSLVTPTFEVLEERDTIWRDTLGMDPTTGDTLFTRLVDSVFSHAVTHFYPDSLVLWYFEEAKQRHYFQGVRREEQHAFSLVFAAPQDSLPVIRALRPSEVDSLKSDSVWVNFLDYSLLQVSKNQDTITYWMTDSMAIRMDSIYLQMQYKVTDSLYNLVPKTDTVLAVYRRPRMSEKAREAYEQKKREQVLELKSNASSKFDIYDTIRIYSPSPLQEVVDSLFCLQQKVDTAWKPINFTIVDGDSLAMRLDIIASLLPENAYVLRIDSAACRDIYGACNDSLDFKLRLKSKMDYASLRVKMVHFDARARIQLLSEKEVVLREELAKEDGVVFDYLAPTTFFLRLYIDEDGDGKWTTGDWLTKRQAEPIYYYPKKLKLRANWDFEEMFDHLAQPRWSSRPKALQKKQDKNQNKR